MEQMRRTFLICHFSHEGTGRCISEIYIRKNEAKEIDFVAVRRDERIYVQECRKLPEESDREIANLPEIREHYPKYVVTLDELAEGNINGVKTVHLAEFLLRNEYQYNIK